MRQLAAIMFADMVGYTALMQENEELAKNNRQRLKEVLEGSVRDFNGKILQYYGDGSLSIFGSAIDGVNCAIEIQRQLQQAPKVDLRIGIHTGDISIEEDLVYGDGVNLASRIESLAVPGSVFITEKVIDDLKNQHDISTHELGYFELKNVKNPVRIFAISNPGLTVPVRSELKGKLKPPSNRLAVLPFVNISPDPENEYFSDGITEELLNALTKVDGLQVISRTSSFAFKGKHDDIREIGIKLNVDKILEGSVRKAGNRVRITAQLINVSDGYHIWSENYDRDLNDIFQIQDEISSIIANRLRENLSLASQKEHLVKTSTQNPTAYILYFKGLHYWNKITPADAYKAIECFEQAIKLEPEYAQAYAMIAAAYSYLGATGQLKSEKAFDIVHRFSEKAMQLDDSIPESHIAKASAFLFFDRKWDAAYQSLQKAIHLNPASMGAYQVLMLYYLIVGKKEEALETMEHAIEIDPLSPITNHHLAEAYLFNERYDDAIRISDQILEINPQLRIVKETKGWCVGMKGDWEKALEYFKDVQRVHRHTYKGLAPIGFAYAKLGQREKALDIIAKMEERQRQEPDTVIDGDLLMVWWALGDKDKVFYYLNQCLEKKMGPINYMFEHPVMKGITDDPRVAALKNKILRLEQIAAQV
ncbi:guanylate cyclase [Chitinophagaceae bacterium LB-8]|uniref:Guanylate cyclase n=1 Tax=Paraflavisolibacter caeni TaxID=2982496 RepID=A0A9X2XT18_9BACT|nr:adenylate/guanylate cyclase domain-containing protein [Paraflavisolibacter caeni]MCU7547772.1 guanylate cyclase [Paraflavisolibacter caeni]